jgi:iron complex outermembrane receptor protein
MAIIRHVNHSILEISIVRKSNFSLKYLSGAGVAALLIGGGLARGQDAPPPPPPPADTVGSGAETAVKTVVVNDTKTKADDQAKEDLSLVPGATSLITAAEADNQHITTVGDLLDFQPGVFVQSAGNSGAPKISIRGSAINDGHLYFRTGIQYLFDGLPITGPSGTPFELWNPQDLARTEIFRGADGLQYGADELGGAINFVTHTGYDAYALEARFDAGSYGFFGGEVSSGQVLGPWDYYVSVSSFGADNYAVNSDSKAFRVTGDVGYQITPTISTRFYFRYAYAYEQEIWGFSKAQIQFDPTGQHALDPGETLNVLDSTRRDNPSTFWFADKTTIKLDDSSDLWFGVDYNHYPIRGPGAIFGSTDWEFDDVSFVANYRRSDTLFGLDSITTVNLLATTTPNSQVKAYPANGSLAAAWTNLAARTSFTGSSDINLSVSNDLQVAPDLWLSDAVAGVYTRRVNDFSVYPVAGELPQQDHGTVDYEGRVGARYDFSPTTQVYANISRSVQPERAFDPVQFGGGYVTVGQLKNQTATSYEIGARATWSIFEGSVALYHSDIENELLSVKVHPTDLQPTYFNASPTTHQGIEIGLDTTLWQGSEGSATEAPHRVLLRQNFTYNNFYYNNDPTFGHNTLPGVPPLYYEAELLYQHPSGFYVGVNTEYSSEYYVDYANTYSNSEYALFGAKIGYSRPGGNWDGYLQLKNLGDVRYASSVLTQYDNHGQDSILTFYPGDGFSVFGGISYHY